MDAETKSANQTSAMRARFLALRNGCITKLCHHLKTNRSYVPMNWQFKRTGLVNCFFYAAQPGCKLVRWYFRSAVTLELPCFLIYPLSR